MIKYKITDMLRLPKDQWSEFAIKKQIYLKMCKHKNFLGCCAFGVFYWDRNIRCEDFNCHLKTGNVVQEVLK